MQRAIDHGTYTANERAIIDKRLAVADELLQRFDTPCPPTTRTGEVPAQCPAAATRDALGYNYPPDALTELATLAITSDDNHLRELATVLVRWPNRWMAKRVARCALELSHMLPTDWTATLERVRGISQPDPVTAEDFGAR